MYTFGQLKSDLRAVLWPEGEVPNLVAAHNKSFLDAVIHLQTWVPCLQTNNTTIVPNCAQFYKCGTTQFDAPRGFIKKLSVMDKINPDTCKEDSTAPDDYCSEIRYEEVDACVFASWNKMATSRRGCCSLPLFFGLPSSCKGHFPIATDEGVPVGLPTLPMGFHYPQTSTDRKWGRSGHGVWAKERGRIMIAPWLQSTEAAIIMWDGIKRTWGEQDPIDDDPMLSKAVQLYVREQHADEWDKEHDAAAIAGAKYREALAELIHQCREETRARECETSVARAANGPTTLYYNDEQSASATCPDGTTGSPTSVTIPAGTVASSISKADANQKAANEAQSEAQSRLNCSPAENVFHNTAQQATVSCQGEEGAPPPEGLPVTVNVPANSITSTVSQADSNAQALALAQTQAAQQLSCTFWNKEQSFTATCPAGHPGADVTKTTAAHAFSSKVSQADADAQALNAAKAAAEAAIVCSGNTTFWNTTQGPERVQMTCPGISGAPTCVTFVTFTVAPHVVSSLLSQNDANQGALNLGRMRANQLAAQRCSQHICGGVIITVSG